MTIDLTELRNEVMEHWESEGVEYIDHDTQTGPSVIPGGFTESTINPEYQQILDDPILCIQELGFDSISEYVAGKQESRNEMQGVELGYSMISKYSTKFFFQFAGRDLEFYIDRDPKTGVAKLWLNPGVTDGIQAFIGSLLNELRKSQDKR